MPERAENEGMERSCAIAFLHFFEHSKRLLRQSSILPSAASASLTLVAIASTVYQPGSRVTYCCNSLHAKSFHIDCRFCRFLSPLGLVADYQKRCVIQTLQKACKWAEAV